MAQKVGVNLVEWQACIDAAQSANEMIVNTPFAHDIHTSNFQQLLDLDADMTALTERVKQAIDEDLNRLGLAGVRIVETDEEAALHIFGGC